ncbi:hypothetical protein [Nocardia sp. NPDC049149]|uniref:hypothetical protein n=1 Tax=Nocardia sp. NPDC049149 TaxID=3364315 RepID=UPI0037232B31
MIRSFARTAVGAAAFAVMTGPPANAQVLAVEVFAGQEGLLTGCPATVRATVSDDDVAPGTVFFVLSGGVIPGNGERIPGEAVFHPGDKTVTATWTPTRIGSQNLVAIQSVPGQYTSSLYITVDVTGAGLDTGSSCQRLP